MKVAKNKGKYFQIIKKNRNIAPPIKAIGMDAIKLVEDTFTKAPELPDFKAGDTISVDYRIVEGNKERTQTFQGVVLQRKGTGATATFTVRKISGGIGVERIFPVSSPFLGKVQVLKQGSVRRAKLFYLRKVSGKAARIKEKLHVGADEAVTADAEA